MYVQGNFICASQEGRSCGKAGQDSSCCTTWAAFQSKCFTYKMSGGMACLHMLLDRFVGFLLTKPFSASFVIRSSENL